MVNGVQCAQGAPATAAMGGPAQTDRQKMLSSVADLLKLSVDDLKGKLASGQSLDDIAKAQGVSHDDLVATISQSIKADAPAGATVGDSRLNAMAERIAGHHRHGHHHHAGAAPAAGPPAASPTTSPSPTSGSALNVLA
jgi:hypothetical protein